MASNSFGLHWRITTFGESHGPGIGVVIDGCPSGLAISIEEIQAELDRRRPGQSRLSSPRSEKDQVQILSGWFEGKTTGAPLTLFVPNEDARPADYDYLKSAYRPSHADYTYDLKYGHRDHRGGGRSSARETAARVSSGAVAKKFLALQGIQIFSFVSKVGSLSLPESLDNLDLSRIDDFAIRCPHEETAIAMEALIDEVRVQGDTVGGVISTVVKGVPVGLGEPVYEKLSARLGFAMMSINASKGFEIGSGFAGAEKKGSEENDRFITTEEGKIVTSTNHSGGIQGGISNGADILFKVAFKPVATLLQPQQSVNKEAAEVIITGKGRHDPCVLPRAVPIVEAMTAHVLMDFWAMSKANQLID
jgi:chorismate synthase